MLAYVSPNKCVGCEGRCRRKVLLRLLPCRHPVCGLFVRRMLNSRPLSRDHCAVCDTLDQNKSWDDDGDTSDESLDCMSRVDSSEPTSDDPQNDDTSAESDLSSDSQVSAKNGNLIGKRVFKKPGGKKKPHRKKKPAGKKKPKKAKNVPAKPATKTASKTAPKKPITARKSAKSNTGSQVAIYRGNPSPAPPIANPPRMIASFDPINGASLRVGNITLQGIGGTAARPIPTNMTIITQNGGFLINLGNGFNNNHAFPGRWPN